ncbi:MAG TPA: LamG domain-containing protein [Verrucomicrobiae bacterium]|nr:LamG domain-containing protein [Verrucomicrobiae bacterium]
MKKTTCTTLTAAIVIALTVIVAKAGPDKAPVTVESLGKGLVLDMKFAHDETSAGKITDSSGQGNNGQATGVRWVPDRKAGGAYEFSADGDQIKIPNNDSLNPNQLTLAVWIKTTYSDKKWRRIFDKSWDEGYAMSVAADWKGHPCRGRAALEAATPEGHCACSTVVVTDGQWHQVVATLDGSSQRVFVDGRLQGLYPLDHWINGAVNIDGDVSANDFDLVIGCNQSTPASEHGLSFRGEIAEPMMWNRALSTNEIAFLFESQEQASSAATNKSAP